MPMPMPILHGPNFNGFFDFDAGGSGFAAIRSDLQSNDTLIEQPGGIYSVDHTASWAASLYD